LTSAKSHAHYGAAALAGAFPTAVSFLSLFQGLDVFKTKGIPMLHYAVVFLVIALIAAVFGFGGIAAGAAGIAKILFVVFLIGAVVTFLMNGRSRI
jgi:uncharacterized membrane protein YtjA (UPF0391 family)